MVEVRGVEPLSKNTSEHLSPSAVCVLTFPLPCPRRQGHGFSSFINTAGGKAYAGSVPVFLTPGS